MYTINSTAEVLTESLTNVLIRAIAILPNIIIAVILILLGWLAGGLLGKAVTHLINMLKVDKALKAAGVNEALGDIKFSVANIFGGLIKWAIIIAFVMSSTQIVGLDSFAGLLWVILAYIPNVIVAALILVASFLISDIVGSFISGSSKAAGISTGMATLAARYSVIVVGFLAALSQLKIAEGFMSILFTGIVASTSLALGLAFGLGGRDAAAKAIEKMQKGM